MDDQKRDDFIVITEFSEREGPISPLTIPLEIPSKWNFNKSKFALRVLGSEFRKKKALGTLPSINVSDMQQFFEDDTNELYIYCHYCSIADFGARGYTRALCLTYITPTPKKIQRIFSLLARVFTETAMILKKAAQKTFLREMDETTSRINSKQIINNPISKNDYEYNDLFQCHLTKENKENILIDMNEIRHLFGINISSRVCNEKQKKKDVNNNNIKDDIVILNRMRHRPHRVGKEGYKPLKEIVGKEDYNKFRDSLRNIHSRFHKNCLDIYVDIKNKEFSLLPVNRLFAIGSLSCLDIEPCHYLCPSWNIKPDNDSMKYLQSIINKKFEPISATSPVLGASPIFGPTPTPGSKPLANKGHKPPPIHPNLFLNETHKDENLGMKNIKLETKPKTMTIKKKRTPKITPKIGIKPSQHLSGRNYKNKKFLKLYDRKLQRIERKNSKIILDSISPKTIDEKETKELFENNINCKKEGENDSSETIDEKTELINDKKEEKINEQLLMNNIWENFIMTRNKCDLEVHKERKNKHKSDNNQNSKKSKPKLKDIPDGAEIEGVTSTPKITRARRRSGSLTSLKMAHEASGHGHGHGTSINPRIEARFRECSDKAREKNLSRCLLGRFRGFAESILFTILMNRTLVILANNVNKNKEKVMKTVRALSLLIPGVENTNSTQEWRNEPLFCHQLPTLKIVGMSSELCHKSPDNIWDLITIIQFDDSILYGPPYKSNDETKSFIHKMLHPRKRFKTPNLFYRYLSRIMLEMSLHVFLFYYISQKQIINLSQKDVKPDSYYKALLETLQFTQSSDIDIAKHWCHIMQNQLYILCKPIKIPLVKVIKNDIIKGDDWKDKDRDNDKDNGKTKDNNNGKDKRDVRKELLAKYGRRPPPIVRIT